MCLILVGHVSQSQSFNVVSLFAFFRTHTSRGGDGHRKKNTAPLDRVTESGSTVHTHRGAPVEPQVAATRSYFNFHRNTVVTVDPASRCKRCSNFAIDVFTVVKTTPKSLQRLQLLQTFFCNDFTRKQSPRSMQPPSRCKSCSNFKLFRSTAVKMTPQVAAFHEVTSLPLQRVHGFTRRSCPRRRAMVSRCAA